MSSSNVLAALPEATANDIHTPRHLPDWREAVASYFTNLPANKYGRPSVKQHHAAVQDDSRVAAWRTDLVLTADSSPQELAMWSRKREVVFKKLARTHPYRGPAQKIAKPADNERQPLQHGDTDLRTTRLALSTIFWAHFVEVLWCNLNSSSTVQHDDTELTTNTDQFSNSSTACLPEAASIRSPNSESPVGSAPIDDKVVDDIDLGRLYINVEAMAAWRKVKHLYEYRDDTYHVRP